MPRIVLGFSGDLSDTIADLNSFDDELGLEGLYDESLFVRGGPRYSYYPTDDDGKKKTSLDTKSWVEPDGTPSKEAARLMMPGDPDGPPLKIKGSSSGGRKIKDPPKRKNQRPRVGENEDERATNLPRFRVQGLSPGEWRFYEIRPSLADEILRAHVEKILVEGFAVENELRRGRVDKMESKFSCYLKADEVEILRLHPGSARRALSEHARSIAAEQIAQWDRSLPRMRVSG